MLYLKWIIFAAFLVSCSQGKLRMRSSSGSRLGDSCEYDDDCDVTFSFCRGQQTCECKRGYEAAPTRDRCTATIGAVCSSPYDCSGLMNAECTQEVCTCKIGYVPHPTMKECLQSSQHYEGKCTETVQCTTSLGDRVECRDNKCVCMPRHHFVESACIPSKALDENCIDSRECHVSDEDDSKNKQVTCTGGRCQCIMGFHMADDHRTCTDGASQHAASLLSICSVYLILNRFI